MRRPTERADGGQMILVGALLLAVTLVALALITNSVIYTENLVSRDEVNTDDAVAFRQAAGDGSRRAIVEANFGQDSVPTAEFDTENSVDTGETFSLDASASGDPDGSISSYEWDFDGDGSVDATGVAVSHTYSTAGSYDVVLTVTDDDGATDTRTQTVSVTSSGATAPEVEIESTSDQSSGGSGKDTVSYAVTWEAAADDGDLSQVTVELFRAKNDKRVDFETVDSIAGSDVGPWTTTVSWSSGNVCKEDVYVTVTAEDEAGKTGSEQTTTLTPSC
jgi:PKD repeat protein